MEGDTLEESKSGSSEVMEAETVTLYFRPAENEFLGIFRRLLLLPRSESKRGGGG